MANNNLTKHKIPLNPNRMYSHLDVPLFISKKCSRPLQCHQGECDGKGMWGEKKTVLMDFCWSILLLQIKKDFWWCEHNARASYRAFQGVQASGGPEA